MANLPKRTADYLDLDEETRVWVQTLNTLHMDRAHNNATNAARIAVRDLRKGGAGYSVAISEVKELTKEQQAEFVASAGIESGSYFAQTDKELPLPASPEDKKLEETEEEFLKRKDQYEVSLKEIEEKRVKRINELFEQAKQEALHLPQKKLTEQCVERIVMREFYSRMSSYFDLWLIYYSTRNADDHSEFYFDTGATESIKKVEDAEDSVREAILKKYRELDTLRQNEIPT